MSLMVDILGLDDRECQVQWGGKEILSRSNIKNLRNKIRKLRERNSPQCENSVCSAIYVQRRSH